MAKRCSDGDMEWLRKEWKKSLRVALAMVFLAGGGLLFDHIAHYGVAFHLTPMDHGVAGLIMIVGSLAGALALFRWGRSK